MNRLTLLGVALALLAGATSGTESPRASAMAGGDRDCADFTTQAQAQEFFEASGSSDPHQLDGDGDGRACEDLPSGCS